MFLYNRYWWRIDNDTFFLIIQLKRHFVWWHGLKVYLQLIKHVKYDFSESVCIIYLYIKRNFLKEYIFKNRN